MDDQRGGMMDLIFGWVDEWMDKPIDGFIDDGWINR